MTTCSWCYNKGHRITTCEEYFDYLDRTLKYHGDVNGFTPKERKHYKAFIAKKEGRKVGDTRKCSFCGSEGHNIRKCKQLEALKEDYKAFNKAFRIILEKGLKGYGPGALVMGHRRNRQNAENVEWSWTGMVNFVDPHALTLGHFVSSGYVYDFSWAMTTVKLSDKWHVERKSIYYNPLADKPNGHIEKTSIPFSVLYDANFSDEVHMQEVQNATGRMVTIDSRKEATSTAWSDLCHWGGGVISAVTGSTSDLHTHSATTMDLVSPGGDVHLSNRDMEEGWTQFLERAKNLFKKNRKNQDIICYATKLLTIVSTIVPREMQEHVPERYRKTRALIRERAEIEWSHPRGYLTNYNCHSGYLDVVHEYDKWYADIQRKNM